VGQMGSQTGLKRKQNREASLTPQERRDLTVYVAQVTRLRRRLDWRLEQMLSKSLSQLTPALRQILRLGTMPYINNSHSPIPFKLMRLAGQ
jgi:transcription termination factor NusB